MNLIPENPSMVPAATQLPTALSLDPEVALKSSMLTPWEREVFELFDDTANKLFHVYSSEGLWPEIAEQHRGVYYPTLERLAKIGDRLLEVRGRCQEMSAASAEERATFFDAVARPWSADFAQILRDSLAFLPDMVEEATGAALSGLQRGRRGGSNDVDPIARNKGRECLNDLLQVEQRVRSLGIVRRAEPRTVDMTTLCQRLATSMSETVYYDLTSSAGAVIRAPAHLIEAVAMVISREMLEVAAELRRGQQRKLQGITVFDVGTEALGEDTNESRTTDLIASGKLLSIRCDTTGSLYIGVPVPGEDYDSLTWLRDRVGRVVTQYEHFMEQIGGSLLTDVGDYGGLQDGGYKEYRLSIRLPLSNKPGSASALSSLVMEAISGGPDGKWLGVVASSLQQRTTAGRSYYTSVRSGALQNGMLACDREILPALESIVDMVGTIESVRVEKMGQAGKRSESETEEHQQDLEVNFEANAEGTDPDIQQGVTFHLGPEGQYLFVFCDDSGAMEWAKERDFNSFVGTLNQLRAVASMGLKGAQAVADRPPRSLPYTNIVLAESFLRDPELMGLFTDLAARCEIGDFLILVDSTRAKEFLRAARRALTEYLDSHQGPERFILQLRAEIQVNGGAGIMVSHGAYVEFVSPSGAVLTEGFYAPASGAFEMSAVSEEVMLPLKKAITEALREELSNAPLLRLVPLADGIERCGFRIPDRLLIGVFMQFKALEGREVGDDLEDRVEGFVRHAMKVLQIKAVRYDGGICSILCKDELLPEERAEH